ncbi:hypothetical protein LTR94_032287, partial [Friedmanniomyces endolithicus]
AGRRDFGHGPVGHGGPAHRASAGVRRPRPGDEPARRDGRGRRAERRHAQLRRPFLDQLYRPVHGRHPGRGLRLRSPGFPVPEPALQGLQLRGLRRRVPAQSRRCGALFAQYGDAGCGRRRPDRERAGNLRHLAPEPARRGDRHHRVAAERPAAVGPGPLLFQ